MTEIKKQNGFSKLYNRLALETGTQNSVALKNPFIYLSYHLYEHRATIDLNDFNQALNFQRSITQDTEYAYDCFLLEISLLESGKSDYLNHIIDFLFKNYKSSLNTNSVVENTISLLFSKICHSHFNVYLNSNNRSRLSKWYTLKEPVKSFVLYKLPEDKWFQNRIFNNMTNGFKYNFISVTTSFNSFKAIFEGKYVENKIDWIDNKSSLYYFIKLLISKKAIENPRNKHWEIVSEYISINGEPIKQTELLNQKPTTNKEKRLIIERFVQLLVNY